MTIALDADIRQVLEDPATRAFIATVDENGTPHLEEKHAVHLDEEGRILIPEEGEYSRTNLNLVRSLWFDRKAVLHLLARNRSYEVVLQPYKVHIAGPLYESYYRQYLEKSKEISLSGVWVLHPETVTEETANIRTERENADRLPLTHLDRIAK